MKDKVFIKELLALNCGANNKPAENGRCYSETCMMNQVDDLAKDIKQKGCIIYKQLPKNVNDG